MCVYGSQEIFISKTGVGKILAVCDTKVTWNTMHKNMICALFETQCNRYDWNKRTVIPTT